MTFVKLFQGYFRSGNDRLFYRTDEYLARDVFIERYLGLVDLDYAPGATPSSVSLSYLL